MKPVDPARGRPEPPPPMLQTLRRELEIAERRADLARDMLRRWLLSHGEEEVLEK